MRISRMVSAFAGAGLVALGAAGNAEEQSTAPAPSGSSSTSTSEMIKDLPPTGAGRPDNEEEDCD